MPNSAVPLLRVERGDVEEGLQRGHLAAVGAGGTLVASAGDPTLADRTWVLITESPEGGWGIDGHANTGADIVAAARAALEA